MDLMVARASESGLDLLALFCRNPISCSVCEDRTICRLLEAGMSFRRFLILISDFKFFCARSGSSWPWRRRLWHKCWFYWIPAYAMSNTLACFVPLC